MPVFDHLLRVVREPMHIRYIFSRILDKYYYRPKFLLGSNKRRAAFICGCGHSGTTLLATMFAEHPLVHVPLYETQAFLPPRRWKRLVDIEKLATRRGKLMFIEKTPRHLHEMDRIRRLVPNARFVLMVRDGRDVAASIAKRFGDVNVGVTRWLTDNRVVAREMNNPDVVLLRYEDLIEDAERELRRVCIFLKLEYIHQLLEYHRAEHLWEKETQLRKGNGTGGSEHAALRTWQVNQPLFDGRGRWKTELTDEIITEFTHGRCRELMATFGYLDRNS